MATAFCPAPDTANPLRACQQVTNDLRTPHPKQPESEKIKRRDSLGDSLAAAGQKRECLYENSTSEDPNFFSFPPAPSILSPSTERSAEVEGCACSRPFLCWWCWCFSLQQPWKHPLHSRFWQVAKLASAVSCRATSGARHMGSK